MALDDIRVSLQLLAESVETLESRIEASEKARAATTAQVKQPKPLPQMDMFGNWTGKPVNDGNVLLAKKLDSTIDKVQNLLREAGAV